MKAASSVLMALRLNSAQAELNSAIQRLFAELSNLIGALRHVLSETHAEPLEANSFRLPDLLDKLGVLLESGDIAANDLAFTESETLRMGFGDAGKKLLLHIRNFEYDKALSVLHDARKPAP